MKGAEKLKIKNLLEICMWHFSATQPVTLQTTPLSATVVHTKTTKVLIHVFVHRIV